MTLKYVNVNIVNNFFLYTSFDFNFRDICKDILVILYRISNVLNMLVLIRLNLSILLTATNGI